jgi:opacity protein-like surface antigen
MRPMRHRPTRVLLAVAALLLLPTATAADAHCIKRHSVKIATGTSPNGSHWTVEGTIGNNGKGCRDWLFGMDFDLGDWSWGSSTGIPAGGSYDRPNDISAFDELLEDGSSRVFAGFVDAEVAKVVLTLSNNQHLGIRPKAPPAKLRHKVSWLRNVRYFVEHYPPVGFVTGVATLSGSGQLLYRDKTFESF